MKRINKSKALRRPRPAAAEFEMTGLAVGAGCGMLVGVAAEFVVRPSALIMFAGGVAGAALGGVVELVRFWWRKRAQKKTQ
ncbi:MAG: hypothetical protein Q8N18_26185 [Opitutaceae bacterium]|nr:hypothetical protein [Opitutaceae bacterium]